MLPHIEGEGGRTPPDIRNTEPKCALKSAGAPPASRAVRLERVEALARPLSRGDDADHVSAASRSSRSRRARARASRATYSGGAPARGELLLASSANDCARVHPRHARLEQAERECRAPMYSTDNRRPPRARATLARRRGARALLERLAAAPAALHLTNSLGASKARKGACPW